MMRQRNQQRTKKWHRSQPPFAGSNPPETGRKSSMAQIPLYGVHRLKIHAT